MHTMAIPATPASHRNFLRVNAPFTLPHHTRGADPSVGRVLLIPGRSKTSHACRQPGRCPFKQVRYQVSRDLPGRDPVVLRSRLSWRGRCLSWAAGVEVVCGVPASVFDLTGFRSQVATHVICGKADHERVRERPGLAPEVPDIRDLDPDLLLYLADDGLFYRLAWLDEARQHAVEFLRKSWRVCQQYPIPSLDEDDGRRAEARKVHHPAPCTPHRKLPTHPLCLATAASAEPVCRMPADDLLRPARHPEEGLVNPEKEAP